MFLSSFINYPDSHIFWKKKALQKAENIIINHNIKLILSSSSPVSSHIIASIISKENNIKWIADLRDLWTQNHAYPYNFIRKFLEVILEKKTFKNVSAITTVSYPLINELKNLHKNKNIFEVTN
jgi:hypothetical protein